MSTGNIYGCKYHFKIWSTKYSDKYFPCTCGFFSVYKNRRQIIKTQQPVMRTADTCCKPFLAVSVLKLFANSSSPHRSAYQPQHNFLNFIPKAVLLFSTNQEISALFFLLHPYIILGSVFIDLSSIGTRNLVRR